MQYRQRVVGADAEHQDQQADDGGEDRPANENVGEVHGARLTVDRDRSCLSRRRHRVIDHHHRPIVQLDLAGSDDGVALLYASEDGHLVAARRPDGDESLPSEKLGLALRIVALLSTT